MSKLPVLMYHNVSLDESIGLTISCEKLEKQLEYLIRKNYHFYFASEIIQTKRIKPKSIVLTFDDVTENQLIFALPLLMKYNVKATFFIPFKYVGKTDLWNQKNTTISKKIMTIEQLKSLDSSLIEFGHHSFCHNRYSTLSTKEIQDDFDKSYALIAEKQLQVYPSLAYPYGDFPKKGIEKQAFFDLLEKNNIKMAFRIGNRVNKFPLKNPFEINRIDVKGEDSLFAFKLKLRFGKLRLF